MVALEDVRGSSPTHPMLIELKTVRRRHALVRRAAAV
jgi:hypothetical protein